jgi:hypothetical protein
MKPSSVNIISSSIASTLRLWNGTWGDLPAKVQQQEIVLFDREDDSDCRQVRETLTELNLDVTIYPCPLEGKRFAARRKKLAPKAGPGPLLHDLATGFVMHTAANIVPYLFEQYIEQKPTQKPAQKPEQKLPFRLRPSLINSLNSHLASFARSPFSIRANASKQPKQMLTLYGFESSPYTRPVRELLCALEIPYHLINLGKLQWADMGPAAFRFVPGPYKPRPQSKREAFLEKYGRVQVPFLIDPNTQVEMFESQDILAYLNKTYAK